MTDDLQLDGNAAAGLFTEVFVPEATAAVIRCASCGHEGAVGAAPMFSNAPGLVLRCEHCSDVVMRFARIRGQLVADLHGVVRMMFPA
jgi:ribosomal protein S27E